MMGRKAAAGEPIRRRFEKRNEMVSFRLNHRLSAKQGADESRGTVVVGGQCAAAWCPTQQQTTAWGT